METSMPDSSEQRGALRIPPLGCTTIVSLQSQLMAVNRLFKHEK
jgi:hypothetical protein